jgi:hypothetical protein
MGGDGRLGLEVGAAHVTVEQFWKQTEKLLRKENSLKQPPSGSPRS